MELLVQWPELCRGNVVARWGSSPSPKAILGLCSDALGPIAR